MRSAPYRTVERLDHVIVRARVEADFLIGDFRFGRDDHDGQIAIGGAQFARQFEPVHPGHHHVADSHIDLYPVEDLQRVLGAFGAENVVSVGAQRGRHHRALAFVVFNKQNAKHSASSRLAGMESVYHILSKCGTPPNTIAVRKKR